MKLEKDEVLHVSELVRIKLADEDTVKLGEDLSEILNYVEELEQAPTEDIEATQQVSGLENVMRPDEIKPGLSNAEVLQNAPAKDGNFIKTKKIFE